MNGAGNGNEGVLKLAGMVTNSQDKDANRSRNLIEPSGQVRPASLGSGPGQKSPMRELSPAQRRVRGFAYTFCHRPTDPHPGDRTYSGTNASIQARPAVRSSHF